MPESTNQPAKRQERPPLEVWMGPAKSGKSRACFEAYVQNPQTVWLIVPTANHASNLQSNLRNLSPECDGGGIVTFANVVNSLSKFSRSATLGAAAKQRVLSRICENRLAPDSYFSRMRGVPGFTSALAELIGELKLSGISPDDLRRSIVPDESVADASLIRKSEEIARIYGDYESFLVAEGFQDDQGLTTLAAFLISSGRKPPRSTVIVDGFMRFSKAWRSLLSALAADGCKVIVTLALEESRPALFATPIRALNSLREDFSLNVRRFECNSPDPLPGSIRCIERHLFAETNVEEKCAELPAPGGSVSILDMPNIYAEAEMVMRELRLAHDRGDVAWNQMQILIRTPGAYETTLSSIAHRFQIPLQSQAGAALIDTPPVKALALVLRILANGWVRSDVVAFFRSSFSGCPRLDAERLLKIARTRALKDGADHWLALVEIAPTKAAERLQRLLEWHDRFDGLKSDSETFQNLFVSMARDLAAQPLTIELVDDGKIAADRAVEVAESVSVMERRLGKKQIEFSEWAAMVLAAWSAESHSKRAVENAVLVGDAYDSRVRDARITVVMGLTERAFPRKMNENPFFRDDERRLLTRGGLVGFDPQLDRFDDERLLFYLCVTSSSERLLLSYPRTGLEGDNTPSFYLDDLRDAAVGVETIRSSASDVVPARDHCASDHDHLLHDLVLIVDSVGTTLASLWPAALESVSEHSPAQTRRIVASSALPPLPKLQLQRNLEAYGKSRRLSVSEVESANKCPFQHFMRYRVKPAAESNAGGAGDRGLLYHSVIGRAFRARKDGRGSVDRDSLLVQLDNHETERAIDAPLHRKGLLRRFLEQALHGFALRESRYSEVLNTTPSYFELSFGMSESAESETREYDPHSKSEPFVLRSPDGTEEVELCGAIDRVDLLGKSGAAMVIDYKTGSTPDNKRLLDGTNPQMPIYLMALESLWGLKGAAACYDSAREPDRKRVYRTSLVDAREFGFHNGVDASGKILKPLNEDEFQAMKDAAAQAVFSAMEKIASYNVVPTPGDYCKFCEYADICRTTTDAHDGEPFTILNEPGPVEDDLD